MPEGPEVRNIADQLNKLIPYEKFKVTIDQIDLSQNAEVIDFDFFADLQKKNPSRVTKIYSYGKKLIIELNSDFSIIFSLGMTGAIRLEKTLHSHLTFTYTIRRKTDGASTKGAYSIHHKMNAVDTKGIYTVHSSEETDGADTDSDGSDNKVGKFYFHDSRRFGDVHFLKSAEIADIKAVYDMGPDLLDHAINTHLTNKEWLAVFLRIGSSPTAIKNKTLAIGKRTISTILLDQSFVAGIGNYLKSEILYYSAILPDRLAKDISLDEWETLRVVSHHIIEVAHSYGGLTIESFINPDGSMGTYPRAVYGKKEDPLGNKVYSSKTKDGRNSFWVPEIQF